jgi:hypothetical protein
MRSPFMCVDDKSHAGFASRWHSVWLQRDKLLDEYLFVPANDPPKDPTILSEGTAYWKEKIFPIVSGTATTKKERYDIEARVQSDIMAYYENLVGHRICWCLSSSSASLVGPTHGGASRSGPPIQYSWCDGDPIGPNEFFKTLEDATFP